MSINPFPDALKSELLSRGLEKIEELISNQTRESMYLEYKQKADASRPALHDNDRKNLIKTVTSFANSQGGILIFGISDPDDSGGKEGARPSEVKPIVGLKKFQQAVESDIGSLAYPFIDGVEVGIIPTGEKDEGILWVYVPRSEATPHRCCVRDENRYYKRVAHRSLLLEHHDLEDMFGRRPQPKLRAIFDIEEGGGYNTTSADGGKYVHIKFGVANEGRVAAKYVSIRLISNLQRIKECLIIANSRIRENILQSCPSSKAYGGDIETILLPRQKLFFAHLRLDYKIQTKSFVATPPKFSIEVEVGSETVPLFNVNFDFQEEEILDKLGYDTPIMNKNYS